MWSSLKINPSRMDPLPLVEDDGIKEDKVEDDGIESEMDGLTQ